MSSMLNQAIVDANTLREAALKSAEAAVVEKYAHEVKNAIGKLLEQDDIPGEAEGETLSTALNAIPAAHDPDTEEDDIVVVDLDQIIAAAEAEEGEEEEIAMDAVAVADEIGIPLETEPEEEFPANRSDDEIDINEEDLFDVFKEMLVVDVAPERIEAVEEAAEEDKKEEDEEAVVSSALDAGMDKKDIEEKQKLERQVESLRKQNNIFKKVLVKVKDRLEEVNLSNARLLYANRVLLDTSLNEQQKNKIVEMVSSARSVEETEMLYETLQKTLASNPSRNAPQSLSEVVSRKSSVILSGRRKEETADESPVTNRWATLAGINK